MFPGGSEFSRTGWTTVPAPAKPTERRAAYVFEASDFSNTPFQLPAPSEAITPDTEGANGYKFSLVAYPGNVTLYIVAGLEDRSETPPRFVPYSMGIARGISLPAQTRVTGVDVRMNILFDHVVTVAPQPPVAGPRGPDRIATTFGLTLGASRYRRAAAQSARRSSPRAGDDAVHGGALARPRASRASNTSSAASRRPAPTCSNPRASSRGSAPPTRTIPSRSAASSAFPSSARAGAAARGPARTSSTRGRAGFDLQVLQIESGTASSPGPSQGPAAAPRSTSPTSARCPAPTASGS